MHFQASLYTNATDPHPFEVRKLTEKYHIEGIASNSDDWIIIDGTVQDNQPTAAPGPDSAKRAIDVSGGIPDEAGRESELSVGGDSERHRCIHSGKTIVAFCFNDLKYSSYPTDCDKAQTIQQAVREGKRIAMDLDKGIITSVEFLKAEVRTPLAPSPVVTPLLSHTPESQSRAPSPSPTSPTSPVERYFLKPIAKTFGMGR